MQLTDSNLPFAHFVHTAIAGEVLEASRIDGSTWLQVSLRVVVPLSSGSVATVVIFKPLFIWNELLMPLSLTSRDTRTITVVLTTFWGQTNTVWEQMASLQILAYRHLDLFNAALYRRWINDRRGEVR